MGALSDANWHGKLRQLYKNSVNAHSTTERNKLEQKF